jgi:predicted small metal-binding protein
MADDKMIRCDCGYWVQARTEERQVAEVRRHAWEAHGISFSSEEALAVLLRLELEVEEGAPADLATARDTETGKEKP